MIVVGYNDLMFVLCVPSCLLYICLSICHTFICLYFHLRMVTLVNINGFSPNLVCALILWGRGLGLLMGKFRQILTELSIGPDKRGIHEIFFLFLQENVCCGYSLEAPPLRHF